MGSRAVDDSPSYPRLTGSDMGRSETEAVTPAWRPAARLVGSKRVGGITAPSGWLLDEKDCVDLIGLPPPATISTSLGVVVRRRSVSQGPTGCADGPGDGTRPVSLGLCRAGEAAHES